MRKKEKKIVITFSTTTEAIRMEKSCKQEKMPGRLIPIPTAITAGCGLAWRIPQAEYERYQTAIGHLGIAFQQAVALKL